MDTKDVANLIENKINKDLEKIGQALVDAMIENNFFATPKNPRACIINYIYKREKIQTTPNRCRVRFFLCY